MVGPDLMRLMGGFDGGGVDLTRINRAHVLLLPKSEGTLSPSGFRPISLKNCDMKVI
jgi:hypothetical protein